MRRNLKFCVANKKQKLNISTNQNQGSKNTFRNRQQNNSACWQCCQNWGFIAKVGIFRGQVGIKIQGNFGILTKKNVSFCKIFQNNQVEISKKWGFFLKMWGFMKNGGDYLAKWGDF